MPAKTSYLDPVIKVAKSSLPPTAYSKHQNWADDMSNSYSNGHAKKGVFQPRERPLVTKEFMDEAKRRGIPPPGAYTIKENKKALLCHNDKSEKSSYHIDMAIY